MHVTQVLRLDEYRDRRDARQQLAEALYGPDTSRLIVFQHLCEVARLTGSDRAAAVWIDEYRPDSVHAHVVMDALNDRPRRSFALEPLREAWEMGIPGAHDRPSVERSSPTSALAVSMGSDGMRAWFLVADSVTARPRLDVSVRDRVMFLAGECSGVLLHRDLDARLDIAEGRGERARFPGWRVLEDLEGRELDSEGSQRIGRRFIVARLVRMLVDDEFATSQEQLVEQVRNARAELMQNGNCGAAEEALWLRVLDQIPAGDLVKLADDLLAWGEVVEAEGCQHGASELYACAYEVSVAAGAARSATDAARFRGRVLRRSADWRESRRWYGVANAVAQVSGFHDLAALALSGISLVEREVGNLPRARAVLQEALEIAQRSGDRDAIAGVHHNLLGLEQVAGNLEVALEHGWAALAAYEAEEARVRCMAGLGGALMDLGDLQSAEDAWTLVVHSTQDSYYLTYAHDALSHVAALKGDRTRFGFHVERCQELGWGVGSHTAKAEFLYYRGLSHRALGDRAEAEDWLERALDFAEEHRFNRIVFLAEAALEELRREMSDPAEATPTTPAAPLVVREGLRAMRQALVGTEV